MIVAASENIPGAWVVERIDDDGGIEQAVFIGPLARDRAFEYVYLKKDSSYLALARAAREADQTKARAE